MQIFAGEYLQAEKKQVADVYSCKLIEKSIENKEYATLLTAIYDNPKGYGRIVRDEGGNISAIVEEKDTTEEEKEIKYNKQYHGNTI